jgi:hypothetical protein
MLVSHGSIALDERERMTVDQLGRLLAALRPGQRFSLPYDAFEELFPPGEQDENARTLCINFGELVACSVENDPQNQKIWFVKDA